MGEIKIVDYTSAYKADFKRLNQEWIEQFFSMEAADHKVLDHPQEQILDKGGHIAIALYKNEPVGSCALLKMAHPQFDYELAKMGVSPSARGLGIGHQLGLAVIKKAKALGAKNIFLESNTVLAPAIKLYKKLGFREIEHIETPYQRCNIQMALQL